MRVETLESSRESMRVIESWPNESECSRELSRVSRANKRESLGSTRGEPLR